MNISESYRKLAVLAIVLILFGTGTLTWADLVSVGAGDYTGSRSTNGGGLSGFGQWAAGVTLSWTITTPAPGSYHYKYTLDSSVAKKDVSHFIIELTHYLPPPSGADQDPYWDTVFTNTLATTYSPGGNGNSNPGLPGDIYGIKINSTPGVQPVVLEFDTTHAPVWGDIYAKDGQDTNYLYNTGFYGDTGTGLTSVQNGNLTASNTSFLNWIPRPDGIPGTGTGIPEPNAFLFGSLICCVLGVVGSLRRWGANKFPKSDAESL